MLSYYFLINLTHALIFGPLLIYIGTAEQPHPLAKKLTVFLGIMAIVYHLYRIAQRSIGRESA